MDDEEFLWLTGALEEAEEVYMDNFELRQRIAELERENERLRAIVESRPAGCLEDDAR